MKINENIVIGAPPAEGDIARIAAKGYATLVNLRTDGEADQTMPPDEEGAFAREAGLAYLHVPVALERLDQTQVDDFRTGLNALPAPFYIHCGTGKRAMAFAMMHLGVTNGWGGEQTLEQAEALGAAIEPPALAQFVKGYVASHHG